MAFLQKRLVRIVHAEVPELRVDLEKHVGFSPDALQVLLPPLQKTDLVERVEHLWWFIKKWIVRFRGWLDGRRGIPVPGTKELTAYEGEIVAHRDKRFARLERVAHKPFLAISLAGATAKSRKFKRSNASESVSNRVTEWLSECPAAFDRVCDELNRAREVLRQKEQELADFVKEHGLKSRTPPDPPPLIDRYATLALVACADVILSFWFMSTKTDLDKVQAIGLSGVACALNMIVGGFLGGYIFHRARYMKKGRLKVAHYVLGGIFVVAVLLGNYMFGIWRDQGQEGLVQPLPFIPMSAFSFYLFILNVVIFVLTIYKMLTDLNPGYPDHKKHWTEFQKAQRSLEALKTRLTMLDQQMRRIASAAMQAVRHDVASYAEVLKAARESLTHYRKKLELQAQVLQKCAEGVDAFTAILIHLYRHQNHSSRRDTRGGAFVVPELPKNKPNLDNIQSATAEATAAIRELEESEGELYQFKQEFEKDIAPVMLKRVENLVTTVRTRTATL